MNIKGAEFMEWYDNAFPEDHFWEDDLDAFQIHDPQTGEWALKPDQTYDLDSLGYLMPIDENVRSITAETAIRRWRKTRDHEFLAVYAPKSRVDAIKAMLKDAGAKVG